MCEDQRELLPVHVELFQHKESVLHLFHLALVGGMIKFDLHVAGGNVSAMAPFTNPHFVSRFRHSMTCAPTAMCSTASKPAVKLQSFLLSLSSSVAAFLDHFSAPVVSY